MPILRAQICAIYPGVTGFGQRPAGRRDPSGATTDSLRWRKSPGAVSVVRQDRLSCRREGALAQDGAAVLGGRGAGYFRDCGAFISTAGRPVFPGSGRKQCNGKSWRPALVTGRETAIYRLFTVEEMRAIEGLRSAPEAFALLHLAVVEDALDRCPVRKCGAGFSPGRKADRSARRFVPPSARRGSNRAGRPSRPEAAPRWRAALPSAQWDDDRRVCS